MASNLDRYKKELGSLIRLGEDLRLSMWVQHRPDAIELTLKENPEFMSEKSLASLPSFDTTYQRWYSEALVLVRQLLPDRLDDFIQHYKKPKGRKRLDSESYRIEDCLQGWSIKGAVEPADAILHFEQQLSILKAVNARFESSLFDIRQVVVAELFDSELDAARELMKKGFLRAAGAVAGVDHLILEKHLAQVRTNHDLPVTRKNPTISNLNTQLREAGVVDLPRWRLLQYLADIRNLCDHNKLEDPTQDQVAELIAGVDKTLKTLY